ncbi:MAG: helix-hairpin-helix domain-containing protein [Halanaerobiaceae bacterium]
MKNLPLEKKILLVMVILVFMFSTVVLIWQSSSNNVVLSKANMNNLSKTSVADVSIVKANSTDGNNTLSVDQKEADIPGDKKLTAGNEDTFADDKDFSSNNNKKETENTEEEKAKEVKEIYVHVAGEVVNTGVYILEEGSRVFQAVEMAGGGTDDAALDSINLAAPLIDGQKIYIPSLEEIDEMSKGQDINKNNNADFIPEKSVVNEKKVEDDNTVKSSGNKIDINNATSEELQTLSGIGPEKAGNIIDYRQENGPFSKIEELTKVSGIGDKTLEKIRDKIAVY